MSYRPYQQITRRKSRQIHVGKVPVGGDAPITVQTMTNTLTTDVRGHDRADPPCRSRPGADIVRVSCPDRESALALKDIVHAGERADRGRHPFPLQARASRRPRAAPPACASIPAISAATSG